VGSVVVINQNYKHRYTAHQRGLSGDGRTINDEILWPSLRAQFPSSKGRFLQTMKTLLTAITVLCVLAGTSIAAPLYQTTTPIGTSSCHPPQNFRYTVTFDNAFGGHWDLRGHSQSNRDGTYTDSFSGTITDTALQAAVTRNDFDWVTDGWLLCHHVQVICSSFSITISDGHITGFATYRP
jgi:hypothetical protein